MPNLKKYNPLDSIQLEEDAQIEQDIANYAKLKKKKQQQSKSDLSIFKTTFTDVKDKVAKPPKEPKPPREPKPPKEPKPPRKKFTAEELRERRNERNRKKYALLKGSEVRPRKKSIPCLNEEEKKERNRKNQRELYWEKHPEIKRNSKYRQSELRPPKEPKLPYKKLTSEELRQRQSERHRKRYALLKAKKEAEKNYINLEFIEEQRQWLAELEEKRKRAETLNAVRTLREKH